MRLLRSIRIPMLRDVKLSDARRKKYYVLEPNKIIKLPLKYQDTQKFDFLPIKRTKGKVMMLCDLTTKKPIVANPIAEGTPKIIRINFQMIWNNQISEHSRNIIALAVKESFKVELTKVVPIVGDYPIKTSFIVHSKDEKQDVDNLTILYIKTFHDTLVDLGIIPDDTLKYLKGYGATHVDYDGDVDYFEINIYSISNPVRVTRRYLDVLQSLNIAA